MGAWHFFVHWTGGDYGYQYGRLQPYDWLSGILGLGILGVLITNYRKANCEVHRCWRIGRHDTAAGHTVCRRHMPGGAPSHADVIRAHHAAKGQQDTDA